MIKRWGEYIGLLIDFYYHKIEDLLCHWYLIFPYSYWWSWWWVLRQSHCMAQSDLELLGSSEPLALASQPAGTVGTHQHTQLDWSIFKCLKYFDI